MRTAISIGMLSCLAVAAGAFAEGEAEPPAEAATPQSVLDFEVETIDGKTVPLDTYRGEVLLIVNVASKCGLTDRNYKQLEPLYQAYKDKGLRILAFPANDFGAQEPGTAPEIKAFCAKYDVTFDLFAKVSVKGEKICPLYAYLTKHPDEEIAGPVQWNFQKYLVGRDGVVRGKFSPRVDPDSESLRKAIEAALAETPEKNGA